MPIKELEDLYATITDPADQAAMDAILERNPNAKVLAIEQRNLYKAFVEGDSTEINRLDQQQREVAARAAATARNNPNPSAAIGLTLDQIMAATTKQFDERFKPQLEAQHGYIEEVAERAAKKIADELGPRLLAQSIGTADTIYSIKSGHQAEFHEPLNMGKFNEFVEANKSRYPSLTEAHDAYVQQLRIDKQIKDGVAAGVAAHDTNDVPGTTLAKSDSMAARFVAKNVAMAGTARGDGLDAATNAFRALRGSHNQ